MRHHFRTLIFSLLICSATHATARAQTDLLIEGAKNCTRFLPHYETQYGIPLHLLSAISSTESGRWHDGLKIALPWPWTINADGKGYYLSSKAEAVATARRLRMQGIKSMDVGCMQVNLMHHPRAFASLEDAFDPDRNVAYAAGYLRSLYEAEGNWKSAAAAYHSKTPALGTRYVGRVYNAWYSIIDKLRIARTVVASAGAKAAAEKPVEAASSPKAAVYRLDGKSGLKREQPKSDKADIKVVEKAKSQLGEQNGKALARQEPVRMNVIKVAESKPQKEKGIVVLRIPDENTSLASGRTQKSQDTRIINVATAPGAQPAEPAPSSGVAHGPRFIFTD